LTHPEARNTTYLTATLRKRPSLYVTVSTPDPSIITEPLRITVVPTETTAAPRVIDGQLGEQQITDLPLATLKVSLAMGSWQFIANADTSAGVDDVVQFDLRPVTLTGTVFWGDKPTKATVSITTSERHSTDTDDEGRFRLTLWSLRRYGLVVTLADHPEIPGFTETIRVDASRDIEIRIPKTAVSVRVSSVQTNTGISHATVLVRTTWVDAIEGEKGSTFRTTTDENGVVTLPPVRIGTLTLQAQAPGYRSSDLVNTPITRADQELEIPIGLEPTAGRSIEFTLPGGEPAAGAEAAGITGEVIRWNAIADATGHVEVPEQFVGIVAVRHPNAASDVRAWNPNDAPLRWRLGRPAAPLRIAVVDHALQPVPSAMIYAWFGQTRVGGGVLAFLTNATNATGPDGSWTGRNLPQQATSIIAFRAPSTPGMLDGTYETLATRIPYPWNVQVQVRSAD
jgi:hypothetical protein